MCVCVCVYVCLVSGDTAEERVAIEAPSYWLELVGYFPNTVFVLHFVGPEVSAERHGRTIVLGPRLSLRFFRGGVGDYVAGELAPDVEHTLESIQVLSATTVLVAFNPGFGAGFPELALAWLQDLVGLCSLRIPCIMTCANDYSDLKGELAMLDHFLKPQFLFQPQTNPFRAVSTFRAAEGDSEWSSSSSHVYAFRGFAHGRSHSIVDFDDAQAVERQVTQICKTLIMNSSSRCISAAK
jgi:hypothetical protein